MISLTGQQQQTPSSQQPPPQSQNQPKTDHNQVCMQDPNQGGPDGAEELMTTPIPPLLLTRDESPSPTAEELQELEDGESQLDEWVELQVSGETSPPIEDVDEDLETPTILWAGPAFETVASDELQEQFPSASTSSAPSAQESNNDTEVIKGDTEDVLHSFTVPVSQQTPVTLKESQFIRQVKPPLEEQEMLEVKMLEKEMQEDELELPVDIAGPVINHKLVNEETTISQALDLELESVKVETQDVTMTIALRSEQSSTIVEAAEANLGLDVHHDSEKMSKGGDVSGTTASADCSQELLHSSVVSETTTAVPEDTEEGNSEPDQDVCSSFEILHPIEELTVVQGATSVPKKRRSMRQLNKKEAIGHLLDAFTEEIETKSASEPSQDVTPQLLPSLCNESKASTADETWEEREATLDTEANKTKTAPKLIKQSKTADARERKRYNKEPPSGFQSINTKQKCCEARDTVREINVPDFTPSYLGNFGSRLLRRPRLPPHGLQWSQQDQRRETRKLTSSLSHNSSMQLNKAENAWRPSTRKSVRSLRKEQVMTDDPEQVKTQQLFKHLRSILNKLTPEKFQELIKQVQELTIDTEERLKGAINLIFEKAILEPNFSVVYASMCHCFRRLKVPTSDKPGFVNFCKVLLNRCQEEFEKDRDDDEILEKKQNELEAAKHDKEREHLRVQLEEARDKMRHRSLGNIKFIGELFKMKMLTASIMDDCIVKLLKNHDEESLECLCRLLSTVGKNLDFKKAKPRMDQHFNQIEKIIKERKTSSRIRFMLQDVLDLRKNNWVPRRRDQGPKTIDQIHKEAKMEEQLEQIEVHQQLLSKREAGGRMGESSGGQGHHTPGGGRTSQSQVDGWNSLTKNVNAVHLRKVFLQEWNNISLRPGNNKDVSSVWGHGCSGGSGEQDLSRITANFNQFSVLQRSSSLFTLPDPDRKVTHRSSSSFEPGDEKDWSDRDRDWFERFDCYENWQGRDGRKSQSQSGKRSFIKELQERGGKSRDIRDSTEVVRYVTDGRDKGGRDKWGGNRSQHKDSTAAKYKSNTNPPPLPKSALTEEEVARKSAAIIEEYLHINDLKEALQCVTELNSVSLLHVFVRHGVESTLERRTVARERIGLLLYQLVKAGMLPKQQFYKGLIGTLGAAEDTAIDIPHIWLYLAELLTPMLHQGGISMGHLFREIAKPLLPLGKAGKLVVEILKLSCKEMGPEKVGAMWTDAGLMWSEFLPESLDTHTFVVDQVCIAGIIVARQTEMEFTLREEPAKRTPPQPNLC